MSSQKFDPVKEFINLRDNISKTIGQSLQNATGIPGQFPAVDVYETNEAVIVRTEPLIGAVTSSFEVSMEGDVLTISGETRSDLLVPETAYLKRELRFGTFSRKISIARKVQITRATASFKKGILTVSLPKMSEGASQIIDVTPAE